MKTYNTIHEAYLGSIADVLDNPDYICSPRGLEIYEKCDYSFKVTNPVAEPIVTLDEERNKTIAEYTKKEMEWYASMDPSVEAAIKCSKFWEKIGNLDGTVNSNYGYLVFGLRDHGNIKFSDKMRTPWEWARDSLIKDKDTRQAIIRFSRPEHFFDGVKDFTCTTHGIFQIRENKLNLSIVMRSNDVTLGIVYDICFFVSLIDKMIDELRPYYPTLEKGTYTHTAHSYHAYNKDFERIYKMLGR